MSEVMAQESLTTPWLSVIVPVVNEAATIQACLTASIEIHRSFVGGVVSRRERCRELSELKGEKNNRTNK